MPLWNFKTFNKEALLMRCSYEHFSQDVSFTVTSKDFFKTNLINITKIMRLIPVFYSVCIFFLIFLFIMAFFNKIPDLYSGKMFDIYLSQAFYFI